MDSIGQQACVQVGVEFIEQRLAATGEGDVPKPPVKGIYLFVDETQPWVIGIAIPEQLQLSGNGGIFQPIGAVSDI